MPGRYNAADALAAVALSRALGLDDGAVRAGLAHTVVPGRAQLVPVPAPFTIVIDYAHNGDSFRALMEVLREYRPRRIIAVFGAGGDRPKIRRTDMGRAAARWADRAVLTADNPRSERAGGHLCGHCRRHWRGHPDGDCAGPAAGHFPSPGYGGAGGRGGAAG